MRIMFSGGGTAGSVTPLLALAEQLTGQQLSFVGTTTGVERQLVKDITYFTLPAGKLRRYWSWRNVVDPFIIVYAFFKAWALLLKQLPDVVVSAGGFVSVPLVWAAWWCNIPVLVHHQDRRMSLATRLMKPFATVVTHATEIGNPVRSLAVTTNVITVDPTVPTILIMGGGTGATAINALVSTQLCEQYNVIHITGTNKMAHTITQARYHPYELLTDAMSEALQKADVVVCRAGFGTISELAALGKASVIIPIPRSHQEANAQWLEQQAVAIVVTQTALTPEKLMDVIQTAFEQRHQLQAKIKHVLPENATHTLCQIITSLATSSR